MAKETNVKTGTVESNNQCFQYNFIKYIMQNNKERNYCCDKDSSENDKSCIKEGLFSVDCLDEGKNSYLKPQKDLCS